MAQETAGKIERVAPRNDFRFFAGVGGGDGKVEDASGPDGGEQRHFGFKLKVMAGGEPIAEPVAAHETKSALAVENAATAQQGRHGAIGPSAQERHAGGIGKAIADDEVGIVAQPPEAFEISGMMLAVAIEKEEPIDGIGHPAQDVMERGCLAVVRSGKRENFRTALRGEKGGGVAAGVVDDRDRKAGATAAAHDLADGGGLVAGGDENTSG